jgi:hypothetical protein
MDVHLAITLIVGLSGGVGGTLMALGFLHGNYFDESQAPPAERLGQGFIIVGAILGFLFGVAKLVCFFVVAGPPT